MADAVTSTAKGATSVQELTRAQVAVARRVAESRATVPDLTVSALAVLRPALAEAGGFTVAAAAVRACGVALRAHPRVNGVFKDARFELFERPNVGLAVEADGGILIPTIRDADRAEPAELAGRLAELDEVVRSGEATAPQLSGGTFTLWCLDASAVDRVDPVITTGQAAALAVGGVALRPVVAGGEVVAAPTAELTLAADHRILTPTLAAAFLATVVSELEAAGA